MVGYVWGDFAAGGLCVGAYCRGLVIGGLRRMGRMSRGLCL